MWQKVPQQCESAHPVEKDKPSTNSLSNRLERLKRLETAEG
jgi:hypothetical protein